MSSTDTPWTGDDDLQRWDFQGDADDALAACGYEAALPGLQWLTAHDVAASSPRAEAS